MRLKTIFALCMLSMAVSAQKAPKGKFLSYSHTSANPEIPVNNKFDLSWHEGKGTLTISNRFLTNVYDYTGEVDENVFRMVDDIIKAKKLYVIGKKKKKKRSSKSMQMTNPKVENYCIRFEGKTISCDIGDLSDEQRMAFDELENFIKDIVKGIQPPAGELVECSWLSESALSGKGEEYEYLTVREGLAPMLVIGTRSSAPNSEKEKKYIVSTKDVQELKGLILNEELYKFAGCDGRDLSGNAPWRRVLLKYDNGQVYSARYQFATKEADKTENAITDYFKSLTKTYKPVEFPKGKMIYCSCAYTNYGLPVGQIQYSYYELIADEGTAPKVIYCEDRGDSKKTEYRATEQDVMELSSLLRDINVFLVNGYNVDEQMMGGTSYRIHMEFSSGEKLNATWFTHQPNALASKAYNTILRYLVKVTER